MDPRTDLTLNAVHALAAAASAKIGPGAAEKHCEMIVNTIAALEEKYEQVMTVKAAAEMVADPTLQLDPEVRRTAAKKMIGNLIEPMKNLCGDCLRHGERGMLTARILGAAGFPELAEFMREHAESNKRIGEKGIRLLREHIEKLDESDT